MDINEALNIINLFKYEKKKKKSILTQYTINIYTIVFPIHILWFNLY